jgi:hypothetical protein
MPTEAPPVGHARDPTELLGETPRSERVRGGVGWARARHGRGAVGDAHFGPPLQYVCMVRSLLERAKSGTYRAPRVRRVYIPKDSGEMRPLGIPTFEDKVLQRAVAMVLEDRWARP